MKGRPSTRACCLNRAIFCILFRFLFVFNVHHPPTRECQIRRHRNTYRRVIVRVQCTLRRSAQHTVSLCMHAVHNMHSFRSTSHLLTGSSLRNALCRTGPFFLWSRSSAARKHIQGPDLIHLIHIRMCTSYRRAYHTQSKKHSALN
jgi:hypothetical protein